MLHNFQLSPTTSGLVFLWCYNPILFVAKILLLFRQQATGNRQQVRVSTFLSTFCAICTNKPVEFLSTERLLNPPTAIDVSGVCLFFLKSSVSV
ncbi:MAG: hypothetical protein O4965_16125 [Trichodesmium sp. St19_bin1]|nr:hypothetical protein [Trichodesmium sp. St19_bin1]